MFFCFFFKPKNCYEPFIGRCRPHHNIHKKVRLKAVLIVVGHGSSTLHATHPTPRHAALSRLAQAMSCLVDENPTCSVPALWGSECYGHTTTAMHDMSICPPPPPCRGKCASGGNRHSSVVAPITGGGRSVYSKEAYRHGPR